ncbi:zinc finger and BTB domain-containing protein 11 [Aplysia californica]|uniref:Zinc finger and BTB domain-containing protein 11 n=1 Tax=Aplysia californica TaxID=6500 RepID=A0ABM0JRV6_APLCA|nr:zinc finger and BTB domain-containing protein 11 [Aplysia californica]
METSGELKASKGSSRYSCTACLSGFSSPYHLKKHKEDCEFAGDLSKRQRKKAENGRELMESRMSCNLCEKNFKNESLLKKHIRNFHSGEGGYSCSVCHLVCSTQKLLQKHMTQSHKSGNKPAPNVIEQRTSLKSSSVRKMRNQLSATGTRERKSVSGRLQKVTDSKNVCEQPQEVLTEKSGDKQNGNLTCQICSRTFARAANLKLHMRVHTGERPYTCDTCGKTFARSDHLKNHELCHKSVKEFLCDECNESFRRADHLKYHKVNKHGDVIRLNELKKYTRIDTPEKSKTVLCDICGSAFNDQKGLRNHLRKHNNFQKYSCHYCGQTFNQSSNLNVHLRKHTGVKPYKCTTCSETFTTSAKLKTHARKHTGELPFSCDVCGRMFGESRLLKMHKQIHSGTKAFMCSHCGKAFMHGSTLRAHVRVHTGVRPYKCDICGKAFAQISSLTYHKRTHSGEKPYSCHICGNSYTRMTTLNVHLARHSGEKRFSCSRCDFKCDLQKILKSHMEKTHEGTAGVHDASLNVSQDPNALYAENFHRTLNDSKTVGVIQTLEKYSENFFDTQDNCPFPSKNLQDSSVNEADCIFSSPEYAVQTECIGVYKDRNINKTSVIGSMNMSDLCTDMKTDFHFQNTSGINEKCSVSVEESFSNNQKESQISHSVLSSEVVYMKDRDDGHMTLGNMDSQPSLLSLRAGSERSDVATSAPPFVSLSNGQGETSRVSVGDIVSVRQHANSVCVGDNQDESKNQKKSDTFVSLENIPSISTVVSSALDYTQTYENHVEQDNVSFNNLGVSGDSQNNEEESAAVEEICLTGGESKKLSHMLDLSEAKALSNDESESLADTEDLFSINHTVSEVQSQSDSEKSNSKKVTPLRISSRIVQKKDNVKQKLMTNKRRKQQVTKLDVTKDRGKPKCNVCGQLFSRRGNLTTHMRLHSGERPYQCSVCNKTFTRSDHLKGHMLLHEDGQRMACHHCKDMFDSADSLKYHLELQHAGKLPFVCGICLFSCLRLGELKDHMKSHNANDRFDCAVCDKSFLKSKELKDHMRTHPGAQPFECKPCGKFFRESSCLKLHMMTQHTGVRPFKCGVCGIGFITAARLEKHMRKHTGQRPFTCEFCGKLFLDITLLNMHIKVHTKERPYQCQHCGKGFTHRSTLRAHVRTHTGTKPYRCDVCGDSFTQISSLTYHRRKHDGLKPYKCTICEKAYTRSSTLSIHMSRHTGQKRVACPQCNFTCDTQKALRKHLSKTHTSQMVSVHEDVVGLSGLQNEEELEPIPSSGNLTQLENRPEGLHHFEIYQQQGEIQILQQQQQQPLQRLGLHSFPPQEVPAPKILLHFPSMISTIQQPILEQRLQSELSHDGKVTHCPASSVTPQLVLTVASDALRSFVSANEVEFTPHQVDITPRG